MAARPGTIRQSSKIAQYSTSTSHPAAWDGGGQLTRNSLGAVNNAYLAPAICGACGQPLGVQVDRSSHHAFYVMHLRTEQTLRLLTSIERALSREMHFALEAFHVKDIQPVYRGRAPYLAKNVRRVLPSEMNTL